MGLFSFISNMFGSKPQAIPEPTPASTPQPTSQPVEQAVPVQPPVTVQAFSKDAGLPLVKQFEGCRLVAYQDIVGVWTIGYGETQWPKNGVNVPVWAGLVITQEQADARVQARYEEFQTQVQNLIKVSLTENQLGALTSFAYNLGVGALAGSTLLKLLNADQPASVVAQQFLLWNKAGGKVVAGLTNRRNAEAKLFLTP